MNQISQQEAKDKAENVLEHILEFEIDSIFPTDGGSSNHTFIADQKFVVKIEKKKEWKEKMKREATVLKMIEDKEEVRSPKIIDSGLIDNLNYRVIKFVEGESIDQYSSGRNFYKLSLEEKKHLARILGEALAKVHLSKDFENFGSIKTAEGEAQINSNKWSEGVIDLQRWWLEKLKNNGYREYAEKSEDVLKSYSNKLDEINNSKLLHMEFDLRNLLFREDDDDDVVVLDWEVASAGDPMLDLVMTEKRLVWRQNEDVEVKEAFREGYSSFNEVDIDPVLEDIYEVFQLTRFLLIHQEDVSMEERIKERLDKLFSSLEKEK